MKGERRRRCHADPRSHTLEAPANAPGRAFGRLAADRPPGRWAARRCRQAAQRTRAVRWLGDHRRAPGRASDLALLNAQLLIRTEGRAALDEKVHQLGEALSGLLGFRYVGPLPPYSFADMSLREDEEGRWD